MTKTRSRAYRGEVNAHELAYSLHVAVLKIETVQEAPNGRLEIEMDLVSGEYSEEMRHT
jgi:hypothetical protein